MTFKFKNPVYLGNTVRCDFTITDIDERGRAKAQAVFTNEYDIMVLEAVVTGIVPGTKEKQVMKTCWQKETLQTRSPGELPQYSQDC